MQFAAAAVAAQVDDGWEESVRREALYSLSMDRWTGHRGRHPRPHLSRLPVQPIAPDIHEAFQLLADHRPDLCHWQWQETLYSCWKQLPHLFPKERQEMQAILDQMITAAARP